MRAKLAILSGLAAAMLVLAAQPGNAGKNPEAGARIFRACAACHSLKPGRHLTGPSLAGIWGRKAGTVEGFTRYSPALKSAEVVWNERNLDAWLADPGKLVPGNRMTFPGIQDDRARGDLVAYLKAVTEKGAGPRTAKRGGMMGPPERELPDLKGLAPAQQVASIRYCRDTYYVTTGAGETLPFWELNLRFKTDSSDKGPPRERPALLRAGMMGDRAFVVFADPAEMSSFIEIRC